MASDTDEWNDPGVTDAEPNPPVGFTLFGVTLVLFAGAMSILGQHTLAFGYMALLTTFVVALVLTVAVASGGES